MSEVISPISPEGDQQQSEYIAMLMSLMGYCQIAPGDEDKLTALIQLNPPTIIRITHITDLGWTYGAMTSATQEEDQVGTQTKLGYFYKEDSHCWPEVDETSVICTTSSYDIDAIRNLVQGLGLDVTIEDYRHNPVTWMASQLRAGIQILVPGRRVTRNMFLNWSLAWPPDVLNPPYPHDNEQRDRGVNPETGEPNNSLNANVELSTLSKLFTDIARTYGMTMEPHIVDEQE